MGVESAAAAHLAALALLRRFPQDLDVLLRHLVLQLDYRAVAHVAAACELEFLR